MTTHTAAPRPLSLAELADLTHEVAREVREGLHEVHADAQERWHVRLRCDENVDVWLISWTTDQGTQLHDHGGSSGAFTVVDGSVTETVWAAGSNRLADHIRSAGDTVLFGDKYVHDVRNVEPQAAVSVHAYSPPLSLMNYYDVDGTELVRLASIWTDAPEEPFNADEARDRLGPPEYSSVDELLHHARARIVRVSPAQARQRQFDGHALVDIRPAWQRARDGEIPDAWIVERNHLEWRLHPESGASLPAAAVDQAWIVVCADGYTSSLAAASLCSIGVDATDVVGGITAWREAGLPVVQGPSPVESQVSR